jgi:Mce-associated membrane protein
VRGGVRQNAADTKSDPVNEDETTSTTASEMLALAEEAEAEAAEAEALAAAARARARAIKLRRDAEALEAAKQQAAQASVAAEAEPVSEEDEAEPADSVQTEVTEVPDTPETEPDDTESADKPENLETEVKTEASPDDATEEPEATIFSADAKKRARRWRRPLRRPRRSTVAKGLAVVVIVAALVLSGYMVKEHRDASQRRERVAAFVAAARQGVVTLTSLDFNDAKPGVQRIVDNSTGTFKDDFLKMAGDFVKVVEQSKVISRGTVQAAAVDLDTMTANSAVVLVAATSEVTNAAGAKQDPRTYRLIVTMTRDGGQLKMSKVEFVP